MRRLLDEKDRDAQRKRNADQKRDQRRNNRSVDERQRAKLSLDRVPTLTLQKPEAKLANGKHRVARQSDNHRDYDSDHQQRDCAT